MGWRGTGPGRVMGSVGFAMLYFFSRLEATRGL